MKIAKILFYLLLFSIPFGTRVLVFDFAPAAGEYGRAFVYLSDVFLVLFLLCNFKFLIFDFKSILNFKFLIAFVIFTATSILFAALSGLAIYNFVRLLLLGFAAFAAARLLRVGVVKIEGALAALAGSAVFQAVLAVWQFLSQSSLGLVRLGEAVISPDIPGVAKIVVGGEKIIRAYGTFPHPNILAAFLLMGLTALFFLWLRHNAYVPIIRKAPRRRALLGAGIFAVLAGLAVSFSRVTWCVVALGVLAALIYALCGRSLRRPAGSFVILVFVSAGILFWALQPYVSARFQLSADEPALVLRSTYNKLALEIIKQNPLGVGIGNQVSYSVQNKIYQKFGMTEPWQFQPIHNIYLLIASEIGILGLLAFLIFLGRLLISNFQLPITAMFVALLLFGLFDHFLWTSQSGQLMLWLTIGIIIGVLGARSSTDRTYPSEG